MVPYMAHVGLKMSYSGFLRGPTTVTEAVEQDDVLLERRDGVDLVLTTVSRADLNDEALMLGAVALRSISKSHPELVAEALEEHLPWIAWLPVDDRALCTTELIADLAASATVHSFARLHHDIVAWRHTAEAWSDPVVADRLMRSIETHTDDVERPAR